MTQRDGATIVMRFRCRAMLEHDEEDWEAKVRECLEADGVFDFTDDGGEVVSIEKWEYEDEELLS